MTDHEPLGPVVEEYADRVTGTDPAFGQPVGQSIGHRIQLAEAQVPTAVNESDAVGIDRRRTRDPPLDRTRSGRSLGR